MYSSYIDSVSTNIRNFENDSESLSDIYYILDRVCKMDEEYSKLYWSYLIIIPDKKIKEWNVKDLVRKEFDSLKNGHKFYSTYAFAMRVQCKHS